MTAQQFQLSHPKYRPDIDGLRAIAVLSVVVFHAFPSWLEGGFIGVDIFFVISGFLISTIIFENLERGTFSFSEFYGRRIKRIFPALLLVLIVSFVFGWFALTADEYRQLGKHIAAGAGFVSNLVLWSEAGYFDDSAVNKPLLHLWSLGIEEQFYIVWPLLLWAAWNKNVNILVITIVVAILSFIININGVSRDAVGAFYSPYARFWELLSGSLLAWYIIYKKDNLASVFGHMYSWIGAVINKKLPKTDGSILAHVLSSFGFFLLVYGFLRINKESGFPGKWAVVPVLGAFLLILAGPNAWFNRKVLSNRLAIWFGLISFPLYLWHWPLLSFARIMGGEELSITARTAILVVSVVLSWLTYKLLERPIRFGANSKIKSMAALGLMALVGFIGYGTYYRDGFPFRRIAEQYKDLDYTFQVDGYEACKDEMLTKGVSLNFCLYNPKKTANSAIVGDSHAEDKFHGLVSSDRLNDWILIGNSSCPPILGISIEADQKDCEEKVKATFNYLINNRNIKNIILAFYGNYTIKSPVNSSQNPSRFDLLYSGLDYTVKLMLSSGKKVTLFVDVPELPFIPKDCVRNVLKKCELYRSEVLAKQAELRNIIEKVKYDNQKLAIYDPLHLFCDEEYCSYKRDGTIMYRDSNHMTLRGSNIVANDFISTR